MRLLKKIALGIAFNIGALLVVTELLDQVTYAGGWKFFLVTGALIGALNTFLKPIIKFFALPAIILSGGLFLILINAIILWITEELVGILDLPGIDFNIEGALTFVLAAILFGLTNWFEHWLFKRSL
ncbi:MAG: hypothetical protein ACD_28C00235G0002 [uncultured bacterium]|nr:MAG: hypothetical protein ACD_28C00235G0002 [uncultured bacterium]KKT73599.1 MAG: Membrane spanning protein [Candidatus Peregrinibacteria bacterium GW2011_GWA2_44_7]